MCHKLACVIIFVESSEIETYLILIIAHEDIFGSHKQCLTLSEVLTLHSVAKGTEKLLAKEASRLTTNVSTVISSEENKVHNKTSKAQEKKHPRATFPDVP